jgi:hypothetical protein
MYLIALSFFLFNNAYSQLKVLPDGSSNYLGNFWTGGINMAVMSFSSSGMTVPCIFPAIPFQLTLGTANNYIAGSYVWHSWSSIYDQWPSDKRLKENIHSIDSALQKLMLLNPIKYDLIQQIPDSVPGSMKDFIKADCKNRLGFIAQDVQKVFPQSVHKEPKTGYYGISTMDLIPVLVKAIQEQQIQIKALEDKLSSVTRKKNNVNDPNIAFLKQNYPNPFNTITQINYFLPKNSNNASIFIYDLQGLQKRMIKLTETGEGGIVINGSELKAGMYFYTLVVDNQEVDTKKMILTE